MGITRNELTRQMADHLLILMLKDNYIRRPYAVKFLKVSFPGSSLTLRSNAYDLAYYPITK